ncbi:MAG: hypothetical protein IPO62_10165 [Saprospiraceae bacterium]|nr:hypothetical protein [Saprospiraceae bacterium]MBK9631410.1 hypothetical protein [Saprospiraceae bacterium]
MIKNNQFKVEFREILFTRIKLKKSWVNELASILNCSTESIYKKIKPDHFFSLDEILTLSQHYNISLDQVLGKKDNQFQFKIPNLISPVSSISDFLLLLNSTFESINQNSHVKAIYSTRELPIFYYFLNKELASFKFYVFSKTIWSIGSFKNKPFSFELFDQSILSYFTQIWEKYSVIESTEYWNTNILDSTLQQISFYYESNELNAPDAHLILDGLESTLEKIQLMLISQSKSKLKTDNFKLFENKILHTSNHVLVKNDNFNALYLTFDSPNFLIIEDEEFIRYTENWFKIIHENSYVLGSGSGHHSKIYFDNLKNRIHSIRKTILL